MTTDLDSHDAGQPSDGLTIDTTNGPVDMVAVLRRLNGEKGLRLTQAERDVVDALRRRHRALWPTGRRVTFPRAEAYRRLARDLTDAT